MGKRNDKQKNSKSNLAPLIDGGVSVVSSVVGTIIGLAVGGPIGAIVGATATSVVSAGVDIVNNYWEQKHTRAKKIVNVALTRLDLDDEKIQSLVSVEDSFLDDFVRLIKSALENDKCLDNIYSCLICELIKNPQNNDRICVFEESLRGLRSIHIKILKAIYDSNGTLSAQKISETVCISEIELRVIVRTLELKGLIRDLGKIPIEWEIREMGKAIIDFIEKEKKQCITT